MGRLRAAGLSAFPTLTGVIEDLPHHDLTRGQIGTVVEYLEHAGEQTLLVEFSDQDGQTLAMVDVRPEQLLALHRKTNAA